MLANTESCYLLFSTILYYCSLLYYSLLYSTLLLLYSTLLYSSLLFSALPYSSLLFSSLLYSALLYHSLLYASVLFPTLLFSLMFKTPELGSFSSKLSLTSVRSLVALVCLKVLKIEKNLTPEMDCVCMAGRNQRYKHVATSGGISPKGATYGRMAMGPPLTCFNCRCQEQPRANSTSEAATKTTANCTRRGPTVVEALQGPSG